VRSAYRTKNAPTCKPGRSFCFDRTRFLLHPTQLSYHCHENLSSFSEGWTAWHASAAWVLTSGSRCVTLFTVLSTTNVHISEPRGLKTCIARCRSARAGLWTEDGKVWLETATPPRFGKEMRRKHHGRSVSGKDAVLFAHETGVPATASLFGTPFLWLTPCPKAASPRRRFCCWNRGVGRTAVGSQSPGCMPTNGTESREESEPSIRSYVASNGPST
jgi:hypothetical protein